MDNTFFFKGFSTSRISSGGWLSTQLVKTQTPTTTFFLLGYFSSCKNSTSSIPTTFTFIIMSSTQSQCNYRQNPLMNNWILILKLILRNQHSPKQHLYNFTQGFPVIYRRNLWGPVLISRSLLLNCGFTFRRYMTMLT